MMEINMQTFSVNSSKLKYGHRLIPKLYWFTHELKQRYKSVGVHYVKLDSETCSVSDGEHSAIPRKPDPGIRYLYGRNIKEGVVNFDPISDISYISNEDYESNPRCHISENDVLIAIYGTVGKSAVYKKQQVGKTGIPRHIANISVKENAPFTPEYLSAFFRSKYGRNQVFSLMTGNLQQLFSLKNIRDFDLPLIVEGDFISKITNLEKEAILCEIKANRLINDAKSIFYEALPFDIRSIEGDLTYSVPLSNVKEYSSLIPSQFNTLYSKTEDAILSYPHIVLGKVVDHWHGVEPGSANYIEYLDRKKTDTAFIRTSDVVNFEADIYPDYYLDSNFARAYTSKLQENDVFFTKDGKIACVGLVTEMDNILLSSGFEILRLNKQGIKEGLTQEYLFLTLSIPEVGQYAARKRTVIASTIPHLRPKKINEFKIPILKAESISLITELIKNAFALKNKRKKLIQGSTNVLDEYFDILN